MSSLALAFRLARRELRGGIRGFRIFLACLVLGVAAIAGIGSLAAGVTRALGEDARLLLGGDVELSFTHRPATAAQRAFLEASGTVSEIAEMRAMARAGSTRALVELKAVDSAYPLYGNVLLSGGAVVARALSRENGLWGAAVEAATLSRLGIRPGAPIAVGDAQFTVRAVIETEPDRSASLFTLGPRVMIAQEALAATGLVQPGSLVQYRYRIRLAADRPVDAWIEELKQRFPEAGWRIRGMSEAAPGVQRWIDRIALYLTLVGLSALLVGGVGIANAVRSYLDGKTQTIAVLKCVGAPGRLILQIYLIQVLMLASLGIAVGLVLGALTPVAVAPLVAQALPVAARIGIYPAPLAIAAAFGLLTTLALSLWPIARAREVPPAALFRDLVAPARRRPRAGAIAATALAVLALAGLTIATAGDRRLAIWFVVGAALTFALFHAAAFAVARIARALGHVRVTGLRLALANLHRPGSPTGAVMLSLGLGLTVMVLITQIEGNFVRTLREQLPDVAPSFFFIDIQPDQIEPFLSLVRSMPGIEAVQHVPSLRGRIVRLNGVPVEQAPIAPEAQWAVQSDRGLTYAATPPAGTRLVAGDWWPADYAGPPLISFDARIAANMGLGIGDTITVNVLGRDIEARIANLREIDWTSLGINFTFVFAPGTLEAAPHTYIATARAADAAAEDALERAVTERFANISAIRVKAALATVERTLDSIAVAARATGVVTLLAGGLVLAGALAATHRRRIYDAVVLKVLGGTRRDVIRAFMFEFGLLGLAAALIAVVLGSLGADLVLAHYLRIDFAPRAVPAVATVAGAVLTVMAFGLAATWRILGQKAAPVLRNA